MKFGYGTYGMKGEDVFDAIPRLRSLGYDQIELCAAPGWPTAPEALSAACRERLVAILRDNGFPPPVLLAMLDLCAQDDDRARMMLALDNVCHLAADLNFGDAPAIVTTTLSNSAPAWVTGKQQIAIDLVQAAEIARRRNVVLALEPHVGGSLDNPRKADWLIRVVDHPNLRLNFDYSHFHVQGLPLAECVALCLPHAVHIHIKDGWLIDGAPKFVLPGDGDLDLAAYLAALEAANNRLPICVEVSGMIWNAPGYEPWATAERALGALRRATPSPNPVPLR